MTLGVIEKEGSDLANVIARESETAGHRCLVFKDFAHVTRLIHTVHVDKFAVQIDRPGLNALDWLEILLPSWPDLPPRTLLLAESQLTPCDATRIRKLGAEVVYLPPSLADAKNVVMAHL